ncbi:MAG TPA: pilus assembly protein N-terminal domain-containing protein, partial [Caulobacteraceae bacterium]
MKSTQVPGRRAGSARLAAPLFAGALVSALLATTAMAQATGSYELDVAAGKSQVLETPGPYTDVMIGDAKIADVVPLTRHSVYVVGKSVGSTSLSIYGPGKRLMAAVNVVVEPDIQTLQSRLRQLVPDEKDVAIHSSNGSLVLSGTVSNPVALHQIDELAETMDPGKVVNMLGVEGTQQVQLEVRFVEMERTVAKALSINVNRTSVSGNPQFQFSSGAQSLGNVAGTPGFAALSFLTPDGNLTVALDALEARGVAKTLAEPTLVAMSGDTASFLAGGEFPYPSAQSTTSGTTAASAVITVAFQQFGISLAFTPTILSDGMINLVVKPEVSSLDSSNGVSILGTVVHGLKVSRASTTVELRDGESFT